MKPCARSFDTNVLLMAVLCVAVAFPTTASSARYINFDVPGAVYTLAWDVNNAGEVCGQYYDGINLHGFLRNADLSIVTFDVPGAIATYPYAINRLTGIAGYYVDANNLIHGFIRYPGNTYAYLNAPGAGTQAYQGTSAFYLNDAGQVAGQYDDQNGVIHGFIRDASGHYTTIDGPGSLGTAVRGLNQSGEVIGWYQVSGGSHSFVRDALGNLTTIDVTGAIQTIPQTINSSGQIAGFDWIYSTSVIQGFVRDTSGNVTFFYPSWSCCAGDVVGMTDIGDVIGGDGNYVGRGFRYSSTGALTSFRDPGAGLNRGQGTYPLSVSGNGQIAGWYYDSAGVAHGFLWKP